MKLGMWSTSLRHGQDGDDGTKAVVGEAQATLDERAGSGWKGGSPVVAPLPAHRMRPTWASQGGLGMRFGVGSEKMAAVTWTLVSWAGEFPVCPGSALVSRWLNKICLGPGFGRGNQEAIKRHTVVISGC